MAKARVRTLLRAVARVLGVGPGTLLVSYKEKGEPVAVERRQRWTLADLEALRLANVFVVEEHRLRA